MTPTQRAAALRLAATLDSRMSADPEGDEEAAALLRELAAEPVQEATPADKAVYSAIAENYAAPQQRKPAQEPVDYIRLIRADFEQRKRAQGYSYTALTLLPSGAYLATDVQEAWEAEKRKYAAPQQRKPLTDEEIWRSDAIMECNANIGAHMNELMRLIRAVEQAHGIKETK
jgi:hypothetical protein